MAPKSQWIAIIVTVLIHLVISDKIFQVSGVSHAPLSGTSAQAIYYGKFAVTEHNRQKGTRMVFEKVTEGATKLDGEAFTVIISIKAKKDARLYRAELFKASSKSHLRLQHFVTVGSF
ncbi:hypothetical protein ABFX02_08G152500 [Erythranthe guttata]